VPPPTDQSIPASAPENAESIAPAVLAASAVQPEPATEPLPDINEWIPAEAVPTQSVDLHVPPFTAEPATEVKPVSTDLPDVVGGILNPTPTPVPVFKSIAMQINDILQARISGTVYEARGITVSDGPGHGVLVTMDGQKFPGVKDVPDEEVRNLIRSSVMEWEKQSKPTK
jgi:hypothetical protein